MAAGRQCGFGARGSLARGSHFEPRCSTRLRGRPDSTGPVMAGCSSRHAKGASQVSRRCLAHRAASGLHRELPRPIMEEALRPSPGRLLPPCTGGWPTHAGGLSGRPPSSAQKVRIPLEEQEPVLGSPSSTALLRRQPRLQGITRVAWVRWRGYGSRNERFVVTEVLGPRELRASSAAVRG